MAATMAFRLITLVALLAFSPAWTCTARSLSRAEYEQSRRQLKSLNKPAVKSIEVDEDIFDCVDIYNQPAFNHPSLKNFTIPAIPNFTRESHSDEVLQIGLSDGGCPDGTVPIRRVHMRDLLSSGSSSDFGNKYQGLNNINPQSGGSQFRSVFIRTLTGEYRGGQAGINVWNLHLKKSQYSTASIQIFHGVDAVGSNLSTIQAGWMVNPDVFHDSNPRLFTFWSGDQARTTGCFNLLCEGFIQLSKKLPLGLKLTPSQYKGQQSEITVFIYVADNGVWWLNVQNEIVGFWPPSLFNHEMKTGDAVQFGGDVFSKETNSYPSLGSGRLPADGQFNEACYMRNLQVVDTNNDLVDVPEGDEVERKNQAPSCYGLIDYGNQGPWHRYFFFGGPGGNC